MDIIINVDGQTLLIIHECACVCVSKNVCFIQVYPRKY